MTTDKKLDIDNKLHLLNVMLGNPTNPKTPGAIKVLTFSYNNTKRYIICQAVESTSHSNAVSRLNVGDNSLSELTFKECHSALTGMTNLAGYINLRNANK